MTDKVQMVVVNGVRYRPEDAPKVEAEPAEKKARPAKPAASKK